MHFLAGQIKYPQLNTELYIVIMFEVFINIITLFVFIAFVII